MNALQRYLHWSCLWRNPHPHENAMDLAIEEGLPTEDYELCAAALASKRRTLEMLKQSAVLVDHRRMELIVADI